MNIKYITQQYDIPWLQNVQLAYEMNLPKYWENEAASVLCIKSYKINEYG